MYIDVQNMSDEEREQRKRALNLKQFSFDSDLKKAQRQSETLEMEQKDLKRKIDRMQVDMDDLINRKKKTEKDVVFLKIITFHLHIKLLCFYP